MKKLTAIFAGLFLLFSASAFTTNALNVSAKIKSEFEKKFSSVSDVTWKQVEDIYVASFKVKGKEFSVAYNEEGELLVMGRYISLSQVPLNVSLSLDEKYGKYTIDESVIELSVDQTLYYITAENEKFKLQIKSDASGNLSVMKKTKK
ncbi:MAG: hypothetical protein ACR2KX_15150 [Chitinophagaceae bacterium]